jgi:hypothetical protein
MEPFLTGAGARAWPVLWVAGLLLLRVSTIVFVGWLLRVMMSDDEEKWCDFNF